MPTAKKAETVEELKERLQRSVITIAADYRGLSVVEMSKLRKAARDAGVEMRVVKNRLFQRAAAEAGQPELAELLDGPTAIIFGYDDIVSPAKALAEYMRTARNAFALRSGMLDGRLLSAAELQDLATLPTRPELLGQLAGLLQAPVTRLAVLLNGTVRNLAGLLDARARQLEEA